MKKKKIDVISLWYNDEFLAPFFLNHYGFATIKIMLDKATDDNTRKILKDRNIEFTEFNFSNGFYNPREAADILNEQYRKSKADWIMLPDSDEFIFVESLDRFRRNDVDIFSVRFFQVYRHYSESDLDPNIPIKKQRRHGDADIVKGVNSHQSKPIIIRRHNNKEIIRTIKLRPGSHSVWNANRYKISTGDFIGAHWNTADPCFCIKRRIRGAKRLDQMCVKQGLAYHWLKEENEIRKELEDHLYDEALF